ncbi:hypothetical protein [Bacillus velezensis]|uniref:hypothetical protein n=1 Tax=Bacillus velezensis TaxID=492670 RepID=UPI00201684B8|nr:hypothetical protein [Bacillus velezensis]
METKKYARIKKASVDGVWYADKIGQIFEVVHENSITLLTKSGGHHSVLKEDAEIIVTEKRPAKVGERVLLTVPTNTKGKHRVGDVFTVREFGETGVHVTEDEFMTLWHKEYEVIVNNANKNEEADGMESVNQTAIDTASTVFEKVGEDYIGSKSRFGDILIGAPYSEAFVKAFANERKDVLVIPQTIEYTAFLRGDGMKKVAKSEQEAIKDRAQVRRDEIVEQAKVDVERLKEDNRRLRTFNISLKVNRKDRLVEAVAKKPNSRTAFYGIAKATPDDCFNVHIGKAIALRRALGLAVPDEYLNAPQPTEVRVGDVVQYSKRCATVVAGRPSGPSETKLTTANGLATRIIDDSREEVGE